MINPTRYARHTKLLLGSLLSLPVLLSSCQNWGIAADRASYLERYTMLEDLSESSSTSRLASNPKPRPRLGEPAGQSFVEMQISDSEVMVDEPTLTPTGPSRSFASDPLEAVSLYPDE